MKLANSSKLAFNNFKKLKMLWQHEEDYASHPNTSTTLFAFNPFTQNCRPACSTSLFAFHPFPSLSAQKLVSLAQLNVFHMVDIPN
jgi:hypothetical protein